MFAFIVPVLITTQRKHVNFSITDLKNMKKEAHKYGIDGSPRGDNLFIWVRLGHLYLNRKQLLMGFFWGVWLNCLYGANRKNTFVYSNRKTPFFVCKFK